MVKNKTWQTKWAKNNWPTSRFARRVYLFLKNKKVKTILDLGCGSGRDSIFFTKKGFDVIALDVFVDDKQQEKLKRFDIKFLKEDIKNIKFKTNSFDVIYAHLSLHYFNDKTTDKIFNNLYNILKPGGYIFVKCKSTTDPYFGQGKKIEENYYDFGHKRYFFTKEYMIGKLKKFKIIKIQKTNCIHPDKASFIEAFAKK
jgi:ubiquinone/menaquinone biosynthesis C-methylase UbiE